MKDLHKTAPAALLLLAVLKYCLRRHALPGRFCVSPLKTLITNGGWTSMNRFFLLVKKYALVAAMTLSGAAFAQSNSIENVVTSQRGNDVIVTVTMKNPLEKAPLGFSTATPARIAFDFPSTNNETGKFYEYPRFISRINY